MGRSRLPIQLLLLPLVPVAVTATAGVAHLASNDVPVTYVDQVRVHVSIPTTLSVGSNAHLNVAEVTSKGVYHFEDMVAQLLVGGLPVRGESIAFTAAGAEICTAVTDGHGRASCNVKVATSKFSSQPATFDASFAGDGNLEGSDPATGGFDVVG